MQVVTSEPEEVNPTTQSTALDMIGTVLAQTTTTKATSQALPTSSDGAADSEAEPLISAETTLTIVLACSSISDAFEVARPSGDSAQLDTEDEGAAAAPAGSIPAQIASLVDRVSNALLASTVPGERATEIATPSIQMRLQRHAPGSKADAELAKPVTLNSTDSAVSFEPPSNLGSQLDQQDGVQTRLLYL